MCVCVFLYKVNIDARWMWRASTCTWKRRNVRISHSMRALQAMRENVCRASVQACMSEIHLKYWLSCDWCAHVYRILFFNSNSMRVFGQLARITEVELILMHTCGSYWFAYAFDARKTPLLMHLFLWVYVDLGAWVSVTNVLRLGPY